MASTNLLDAEYESALFSEPIKPTRAKSPISVPYDTPSTPSDSDAIAVSNVDSKAFDPLHAVVEPESEAETMKLESKSQAQTQTETQTLDKSKPKSETETDMDIEADFRLRASFIYSTSVPLQAASELARASPTPSINILDAPEEESLFSPPPSLKPQASVHAMIDSSSSTLSQHAASPPPPPFPFEPSRVQEDKLHDRNDYSFFDPLNPTLPKKDTSLSASPLDDEEPFYMMMMTKSAVVSPIFEKNELELRSEIETIASHT